MTRPHIPQEVIDAAHARKAARLARAWGEADRLKAQIEAAGWRVVDRGVDFALSPLHPADVIEDGRTRYGWSGAVPSRLETPATAPATIVARVGDDPDAVDRARSLLAGSPSGTQLVLVAASPSEAAAAALEAIERAAETGVEAVWLAGTPGTAAAWNAGMRRAAGGVIVLAGGGIRGTGGDAVFPLLSALQDPTVAVAGARALTGNAVQDLQPGATAGHVPAVDETLLAFRREDFIERGPLDERFRAPRLLAAWWCLGLRDAWDPEAGEDQDGDDAAEAAAEAGAEAVAGAPADAEADGDDPGLGDEGELEPPRLAVAIPDPPVRREAEPTSLDGGDQLDPAERERLLRRDRYRLLEAFRDRDDLLGKLEPRLMPPVRPGAASAATAGRPPREGTSARRTYTPPHAALDLRDRPPVRLRRPGLRPRVRPRHPSPSNDRSKRRSAVACSARGAWWQAA